MLKMKTFKRFAALVLAFALVFTGAGVQNLATAEAATITQSGSEDAVITATVYEALSLEDAQKYLKENYPSVNVEVDGEDTELTVKKWVSDDYNPERAGAYTFTPVFSGSYDTADGVELPVITVVLETNTIVSVDTEFSDIEATLEDISDIDDVKALLPEEVSFIIDLRTEAEYASDCEEDASGDALQSEESGDAEDVYAQVTLSVQDWICDEFSLSSGTYSFSPDFGDDFEYAYEYESGLEEPSVTVYITETVEEASVTVKKKSALASAVSETVEDGEGYVTSIDSFTIQLASGATLNDDGDYVWTATSNASGHKYKFRVNYSTSGVGTVAAGTYEFRVPASILVNRDGESADSISMSYPSKDQLESMTEEQLEAAEGFAYYIDGDDIVIYNFKEISAAQTGYFEISYITTDKAIEYIDYGGEGAGSEEFTATLSVSGLTATDDPITVYIDTSVEISSTSKGYPTKYTSWQSSWGERPDDVDGYVYLVWEVTTKINSDLTQYYDFILSDSTVTYSVTYSDGTTVTGDLSDGGVQIVAYKMQGSSYVLADDYTGIEGTAEDLTGTVRYDFVVVALSADVFTDDATSYTVTNTVTATVDPADGADDSTSKTSTKSFSWTQTTKTYSWGGVTGSFYINKYGNENGYYGSYISYNLNTLQEEDATSETSLGNIRYNVVAYGYAYPYTLRDDWSTTDGYSYTISSGKSIPAWNAYGYNSVTYVVEDDTLYPLNSDGTDLNGNELSGYTGSVSMDDEGNLTAYADTDPLESDDYDIEKISYSVSFKDAARDDNDEPTVTSQYKLSVSTKSAEDTDIITLYVKSEDAWYKAGTYNLGTSTWTADDEGGSFIESMTSSLITFNEGVDGYRMVLSNNYYYTSISATPCVTLFATDDVKAWVGTEEDGTQKDVVLLRNAATLNTYYADEYEYGLAIEEAEGTQIADIGTYTATISEKGGYAYYNYTPSTTDTYTIKTSTLSSRKRSVYLYDSDGTLLKSSTNASAASVSYELEAGETYYIKIMFYSSSYTGSIEWYLSASGDVDAAYTGVSDIDTIVSAARVIGDRLRRSERDSYINKTATMTANDVINKTYTLTWKITAYETLTSGSGTTEYMEQDGGVFYDLLPYGNTYEQDSVLIKTEDGYLDESEYKVETIDNYSGSGRTMLIITIYTAADYYTVWLGTVFSWESINDTGFDVLNPVAYETGNDDIANGYADNGGDMTEENDNAAYFVDLDSETDAEKFLYSYASVEVDIETAAATGLTKKVRSETDETYSYSASVTSGSTYSYQLRYANTYTTESKYMIMYDSLENYQEGEWKGTLTGIDTTQLENLGIDPKVYISTVENLDLSDAENTDLSNTDIWTLVDAATDLSSAKAVAVDMTYAEDGSLFILEEGASVVVTIYLEAPDADDVADADGDYPKTYNNVYMSLTSISESSVETEYYIHHDYTTVSYVVTGDVYLEKVNEQDTDEVISGITFVLYGTSDYGTVYYEEKTTNKYGVIEWEDIEKGTYTLQEIGEYDDWLADHNAITVVIGSDGTVTVAGEDVTDGYYVFENEPRIHADVEFSKRSSTGLVLGEGFTFRLYGVSDYGNTVNVYAQSDSSGYVTFEDIEMGTYTLTEIEVGDGYYNDGKTYTVTVDEFGQVNIQYDDETVDTSKSGVYIIYNSPYGTFTILKRSSYDNTAVSGVEFTLKGTSDYGTYYESVLTTGENGSLTFEGLEPGTYTLEETSVENADPSVTADSSVRVVVIDSDGAVTVDGEELNSYGNYTIINTEVADGTVSVIKYWDTEDTSVLYDEDGTPLFPTLVLTTEDPAASE